VATALGLTLLLAAPAFAADSEMFKGKTITYIVATGPGGGYDTYGRLIARYLQKHSSGLARPGAQRAGRGPYRRANTIYAAKTRWPDHRHVQHRLDLRSIAQSATGCCSISPNSVWIGKAADDTRALMISKTSPFKTVDDMIKAKTPIKFAAAGIGSAAYNDTRILADALHLNPDHSGLHRQ